MPSVTMQEVMAVCRELEIAGMPITRRSVREKLGRGSMTTIHNGVTQFESVREIPAPVMDLTPEDRNVIADLGARALAIAEGRVERVLAERESALLRQVAAANARADDAIAAAEAMISDVQHHRMVADAASETAKKERDEAVTMADEAHKRALYLEGQLAQLTASKAAEAVRHTEVETDLVAVKMQCAREMALRVQREDDVTRLQGEMAKLRDEYSEQAKDHVESLIRIKEVLALEHGRVVELENQHNRDTQTVERLERQTLHQTSELSKCSSELTAAIATIAAHEQTIQKLSELMSDEQSMVKHLITNLAVIDQQAAVLHTLGESIASLEKAITSNVQPRSHE